MSLALDLQAFLPSFTGDLEKAFVSERETHVSTFTCKGDTVEPDFFWQLFQDGIVVSYSTNSKQVRESADRSQTNIKYPVCACLVSSDPHCDTSDVQAAVSVRL